MRVLLFKPSTRDASKMRKGRRADYPPLGAMAVASYLQKHGVHVEILDNNTECLDRDALFQYFKERKDDFDVYGISCMIPSYTYVKHLSYILKELTGKPIMLGGPLATYNADKVISNSAIDYCVIGEGQETALDLINNLSTPQNVPGVCYRDENGEPRFTEGRVLKEHLDDYPFPAWDLLDMDLYLDIKPYSNTIFKGNAPISRVPFIYAGLSCPYFCTFCSKGLVKARLRSVDNIVAEIKYLKQKYKIDGVRFADNLLIIGKQRTKEFCRQIEPLDVVFSGQARANTIDDDTLVGLKKAGCVGFGLGIESGSDRLLALMKKRTTREEIKRALLLSLKHEVAVKVQLIFGFPGENRESIEETLSLFRETGYPPRRFNVITPLPGSSLYDDCLDLGIITDENKYLEFVSTMETGFASKKIALNLTKWSDKKFLSTLMYAEDKMGEMIDGARMGHYGNAAMSKASLGKTISWLNRKQLRLRGKLAIRSRIKNVFVKGKMVDQSNETERFYDLTPLLPPDMRKTNGFDPDSWNGVTPEKIEVLIEKYTQESRPKNSVGTSQARKKQPVPAPQAQ